MAMTSRGSGLPEGISIWTPDALIATWFGVGLLRPAPGTWGSIAALPLGAVLAYWLGPWVLAAGALAVFLVGWWASNGLIARLPAGASHDLPSIVVDEVAGQLIALLPAAFSPVLFGVSFALFRMFDISKVGPIGYVERRLPGGLGVMADDVVAGVLAAIGVWLVSLVV